MKWTEAEKSDVSRFQPGMILKFHQNQKGIKRGESFRICESENDKVFMESTGGKRSPVPLERVKHFSVYGEQPLDLAVGDRIRITENGRAKDGKFRLDNGRLATLKGFTRSGDLIMENGKVIDKNYGHLTHGYCVTSYAAQGKTVDTVILSLGSQSNGAINARQFYVDASRGRHRLMAFTDDKETLRQAVQRPAERIAATELIQNQPHLEVIKRARRQDYLKQRQQTIKPNLSRYRGRHRERERGMSL